MFEVGDKCRFKTEKELLNAYGEDWRNRVGWNYYGDMDYLFGKDFTISKKTGVYSSVENTECSRWLIFDEMLAYKEGLYV